MSRYLSLLTIGEDVPIRGPLLEDDELALQEDAIDPSAISAVGMIAAGTGITPMLQILHSINVRKLREQNDQQVYLLYINRYAIPHCITR